MKSGRKPSHEGDPSGTTFTSSLFSSRQKQYIPADVLVPPQSTFARVSPPASSVRRKPLPPTASPLATRFSQDGISKENKIGAVPVASTSTHTSSGNSTGHNGQLPAEAGLLSPELVVRDLDRFPRDLSPLVTPTTDSNGARSITESKAKGPPVQQALDASVISTKFNHVRLASHPPVNKKAEPTKDTGGDKQVLSPGGHNRAATMSLYSSSKPPNLTLSLDTPSENFSHHQDDPFDSNPTQKLPKSPSSKFTSFFGWKTTQSPGAASFSTAFSDKSSPAPSPALVKPYSQGSLSPSGRTVPAAIDIPRANANTEHALFTDSGLSVPPGTPSTSFKLGEMEEELRQITSELASSIRREMDLEDLVDRLQAEANHPPGYNRRTSDYFSDSGNSSIRYAHGDGDAKQDELEKLQRRAEQEKAQLRLELTQRIQDERLRRKSMEEHIRSLEEKVSRVDSQQSISADNSDRIKELEASLEDARRRLSEERQVKENFEDLLGALRSEIQESQNERDNLRDEVVPQLRARVEGLESEAADLQRLTYENTRMQQELQSLRNENSTLVNARKLQLEMQQQQMRFNAIQEEGAGLGSQVKSGVSRATARNSMSGPPRQGSRSSSLSRSNSLKDRDARESLADRVKDIEAQRDALHRALRSLLERQEYQDRENAKKIYALERERDLALSGSPRRAGYDKDVRNLREEINHLRRRADEALEQKWQCEKGLGGLKMDLDRAEQETSSLRQLLQEHDIAVPEGRPGSRSRQGVLASSASLENAYKELQATHTLSLVRIEELETRRQSAQRASQLAAANAEAARTMELLKQSITDAEAERDFAQKQVETYRQQAESLQQSERSHMEEEQSLANQLRESAARVEELAAQVRQQLASNSTLRERLAEAIGRGEREQKASAARINEMQNKLKALEDKVMAAQQHSEEAISKHEAEINALREAHNAQLQRMKNGLLKSPAQFSPKSPLSPLFTARSPRLDRTTTGLGMSMSQATKTEFLEKRVEELEKALSDADKEMEEVVGRMNLAQIEVMELQSERDEAMRQTRKLQAEILSEREKVKVLMR